jgi:hypothetical protein
MPLEEERSERMVPRDPAQQQPLNQPRPHHRSRTHGT